MNLRIVNSKICWIQGLFNPRIDKLKDHSFQDCWIRGSFYFILFNLRVVESWTPYFTAGEVPALYDVMTFKTASSYLANMIVSSNLRLCIFCESSRHSKSELFYAVGISLDIILRRVLRWNCFEKTYKIWKSFVKFCKNMKNCLFCKFRVQK